MSIDNFNNAQPVDFGDSFIESIDLYLDELSELSNNPSDSAKFYRHLTNRLREITSVDSAVLWVLAAEQHCIAVAGVEGSIDSQPNRFSAADFSATIKNNKTRIQSNSAGSVLSTAIGATNNNPKVLTLQVAEIQNDDQVNQRTGAYRSFLCDLLGAVGDIADKFEQQLVLRSQNQRLSQIESFLHLVQNANGSLDETQVGYHIVNDSRAFLQAERVWLFSCEGRIKLTACSNVDSVNQRSEQFLKIKRLAQQAINGQNLSHEHRFVTLLSRPGTKQPIGVLVSEFNASSDPANVVAKLNQIVPPVQAAFTNALTHSGIPFRRTLQRLGWFGNCFRLRALPRTGLAIVLLACAIAAMFLVKVDHWIDIQGQLRPLQEQNVFAPADAFVDSVLVEYGDIVSRSQPIVQLRSNEYELRLTELQNELSASRARLESNRLLRSQAGNEDQQALYIGQLTAEIEKNLLEIEQLNQKIKWFLDKQQQLCLKAPIDGQVITPELHTNLINRPVQRGNHLLAIANTNGVEAEWQIVFEVEDRDFGYMRDAIESDNVEDWTVQYRLESKMDQSFEAKIASTDQNNSFRNDQAFVKSYVPIDRSSFEELRVGQSVLGKVNCGQKSLFEIWTRDLKDFIRTRYLWF